MCGPTEAHVVLEGLQEEVALLPVVPAGRTRAPGGDVGRGVIQVVGGDGASWRRTNGEQGLVKKSNFTGGRPDGSPGRACTLKGPVTCHQVWADYNPFWISVPYDITGGRVHLDV